MKTKPIPIALPHDLLQQVDEVQQLTGMSKADIMRLCMRIGLVDLRAAEHDIPGIVKQIADDKGISFTHFVNEKQPTPTLEKNNACAVNVPSKSPSLASPAVKTSTANIVPLPMPPMLKTVIHDSLKVAESPTPCVATKRKRKVG